MFGVEVLVRGRYGSFVSFASNHVIGWVCPLPHIAEPSGKLWRISLMNGGHCVIRLIFAITHSRSNYKSTTQAGVIAGSLYIHASVLHRGGRWDWLRTGGIGPTGWCSRRFFCSRYSDMERRRGSPDLRAIHDSNLGRYLQRCEGCGCGVKD